MLDEFRSTYITWDKATSRIYSPVTANESDENGRKLVVQIVNGGQVEDLTGATLHLYWITRDKAHDGLDVFDAVDLKNGEFELSYTTGMLSNKGVLNANLVLVDTVGRVVSERFKITVTEGIDNDAIQSENSFSSLTQALIDISDLEQNYAPRLNDLTAQLQQKATKGDISVTDINKNKGLLDETYMTEEFKQQMAGTTPVNAVPAKGSIVQSMHAYPAIEGKESFNKFNPATITPGVYIEGNTGTEVPLSDVNTSDYIKVNPLKKHFISVGESDATLHIVWYDANKYYIGGIAGVSEMGHKNAMVTPPSNAVYARLSVKDSQLTNFLFCESDTYQEYQPFKNVVTVNDLEFKPSERIATKNLFNKNTVTKGKYISFEFGDPRDLLGYNASEFIPVKPMTEYTYLKGFGNPEQLAFYDINKRHIGGIAAPDELITTPADAYFVRFSVTDLALDTFLFGEGTVEKYEPYGAFIPKEHLYPDDNISDETTTLVVAKDGSGDFTSIYGAVSSIVDASKYKPYNVLIHEGEYDVISELPVGMVANPTPAIGNRGLELPPFVNLIGVGIKEKIILKGELLNPTVDQAQYLSTVNYYSSNRLENLTITARNLRYPIHADGNRGACHYTIDNCEVIHYGNDAGLWATCHAFGSGFGSGSRLEMHNSKFTTYGTYDHARAWSTHNWDNLDEPSTVVISECELLNMNDGVAVFFGSLGSGQQDSAIVKNSYVKGSIVNEENEVGSGVGIDFTVESYNLATTDTVDSEVVLARGGEPTLGVRLDKQDDATKDITSRVNYIEGYIDYRDDDIVGIEADFANSTFTRIAASSGLSAGTDFNAFEPFGGRRRCTVLDNGTVTSYFGDANFAEDGSIGQVMVEQPKFYYKVVPLKLDKVQDGKGFHLRKARYYVSAKHKPGFKIHPAFVRNGKEKNFVYLSAYEGAIYDESAGAYILDDAQVADFAVDKLSSISGTKPASGVTQNLTRANTRKLAQNRGLGWEQAYGATVAATQLLFAIEYASFNTQSAIGMGVSKTDDGATNRSEPTGATTLVGNTSGKADNGSITYRGEENFWMNIWKWVDGLNIEAKGLHNLFVADNAFADDVGTTPYQDAGITLAKTSGYISAFAYNEKFDWLFFPSETSGNSSVPVGDNFYQNNTSNSWLAARLGGAWSDGANGGGFFWHVSHAASTRNRLLGGRLVYVPGVVA